MLGYERKHVLLNITNEAILMFLPETIVVIALLSQGALQIAKVWLRKILRSGSEMVHTVKVMYGLPRFRFPNWEIEIVGEWESADVSSTSTTTQPRAQPLEIFASPKVDCNFSAESAHCKSVMVTKYTSHEEMQDLP